MNYGHQGIWMDRKGMRHSWDFPPISLVYVHTRLFRLLIYQGCPSFCFQSGISALFPGKIYLRWVVLFLEEHYIFVHCLNRMHEIIISVGVISLGNQNVFGRICCLQLFFLNMIRYIFSVFCYLQILCKFDEQSSHSSQDFVEPLCFCKMCPRMFQHMQVLLRMLSITLPPAVELNLVEIPDAILAYEIYDPLLSNREGFVVRLCLTIEYFIQILLCLLKDTFRLLKRGAVEFNWHFFITYCTQGSLSTASMRKSAMCAWSLITATLLWRSWYLCLTIRQILA